VTGFSLKDHLFNREKILFLADLFDKKVPGFSRQRFVSGVMKKLPDLELKQRIAHIANVMASHLPDDYPQAAQLIVECLPPPLDESKTDDDFGDFIIAPFGEYIVKHGMAREHLSISFSTLRELTMRFSMEDAMRYFIREYPTEAVKVLKRWVKDGNYHVRRLVSESTRPLLPWSGRINLASEITLPLLSTLHTDPTRYVTRSVANHLNDISKDDPDLVVETIRGWQTRAEQHPKELEWITRHSLRTSIKKGHTGTLELLGFHPNPKLELGNFAIKKSKLKFGEPLQFSFDLKALRNESLVVDYAIEFLKSGGKRSSKVFKATTLQLKKGESRSVSKTHKLSAEATTYRLYPGEHRLTIQINGVPMLTKTFELASC
jgi:3-methyladenine DNA glycosylase AlkC